MQPTSLPYRIAVMTLIFMSYTLSRAQNELTNEKENQLIGYMKHVKVFQATYPQEKVYVHFDNTAYFVGESIYFKTYIVRSDNGKPTDISKVLYIDLVDPSGYVIRQKKLKIEEGMANGDFMLDSIASTGFYEVRAYTRYMLNFGDQTAFSRVFPIFNKPKEDGNYEHPEIDKFGYYQQLPKREFTDDSIATLTPAENKKKKARGYQVNIYPEGGKLVKGLYSKVAFSVSDPEHHPVELRGEVVDNEDNTLAIITTDKSGHGFFNIVPTSIQCRMRFTTPNKKLIEFELPDAEAEGIVMTTDPVSNSECVLVDIQATKMLKDELMGLTVMNNGNIYISETIDLKTVRSLDIIRDKLRPGVNQITLFDSNGHIQAERLIFTYPTPAPADSIVAIKTSGLLKPCEKVKMTLKTQPGAHISFSAMDYDNIVNGKLGNINTYMLLSSDVQGFIANPDYYFESDDTEHRMAADSLMLFNGWRRYDWEVMSDVSTWQKPIQPVEDELYIYGHLRPTWSKLKKNHPVDGVNMELYLYNDSGAHAYGSTVTDSTGFYAFQLPQDVYGDWNMQILTKIKKKLKSFSVTIDRQFKPKSRYITEKEVETIPLPKIEEPKIDEIDIEAFEAMRNHAYMTQTGTDQFTISPATVKRKKSSWKDHKNPAWDEYNARLHANIYYNCKEIMEEIDDKGEVPPTFYDWLIAHNTNFEGNYYTGMTYLGRPIIWIVNNMIYAQSYIYGTEESPHIKYGILSDQVSFLHLSDWMTVFKGFMDELRSIYIWSDQGSRQEAIIVYMFTEPYVSTESNKGRRRTHFHGYDKPTKFHSDDYNIMPPSPSDYRRTLWWQPDVVADSEGKAEVEFFNNSSCTNIYVSAEGMTTDGKLVTTK